MAMAIEDREEARHERARIGDEIRTAEVEGARDGVGDEDEAARVGRDGRDVPEAPRRAEALAEEVFAVPIQLGEVQVAGADDVRIAARDQGAAAEIDGAREAA